MLAQRLAPAELDSARLGGFQAGVDAFHNDGLFEFSHRHEDAKLKTSSGVVVAGVDSLRRANERDTMRPEFGADLRQVRQATPEPVELEANNGIELAASNLIHQFLEARAGELRAADHVRILGNPLPPSPLAVFPKFQELGVMALQAGTHSGVNCDSHDFGVLKLVVW